MPGKGHAGERQADAPADLHVDDGERDRDAGLAVDHVVEIAVARVIVVARIAHEAEIAEQELVQRDHLLLGAAAVLHARAQADRQAFNLREVALDVEPGISVLGDEEADAREVDARIVLPDRELERLERRAHQPAPRREKSRRRKPNAARQAA